MDLVDTNISMETSFQLEIQGNAMQVRPALPKIAAKTREAKGYQKTRIIFTNWQIHFGGSTRFEPQPYVENPGTPQETLNQRPVRQYYG